MKTTTFLTREEVADLTGAQRKQRQIDMLKSQRLPFYIDIVGWPVVPRAAVEGGRVSVPAQRWEPNPAFLQAEAAA